MKYQKNFNKIIIFGKEDFNPAHILDCGQIFRYEKVGENYVVYSKDFVAKIIETKTGYEILTSNVDYFENFFDLKTNYSEIKNILFNNEMLKYPIKSGFGVRILKNDFVEILISFIISANNNIKRIKQIINRLCEGAGTKSKTGYFCFPTVEQLASKNLNFYENLKAGYRGKYLFETAQMLKNFNFFEFDGKSSEECRNILIKFKGVGRKVADCVLLFGLNKMNVFPVDTWMEKQYYLNYTKKRTREQISAFFVKLFGENAGYAQQYLFYSAIRK